MNRLRRQGSKIARKKYDGSCLLGDFSSLRGFLASWRFDLFLCENGSSRLLIAAGFVAAVAPTLSWQEFTNTPENLVVESALEIRRDESGRGWRAWLMPTLEGQPANQETAAGLVAGGGGHPPRHACRHRQPRPRPPRCGLPCAGLGRPLAGIALDGPSPGSPVAALGPVVPPDPEKRESSAPLSALVAASTYLLLRFGRLATTDTPLALWVTLTNLCLAASLFRGKRWGGCLGAGCGAGLAVMAKGPLVLAQLLVPLLAFLTWRAWDRRGENPTTPPATGRCAGPPSRGAVLDVGDRPPLAAGHAGGQPQPVGHLAE